LLSVSIGARRKSSNSGLKKETEAAGVTYDHQSFRVGLHGGKRAGQGWRHEYAIQMSCWPAGSAHKCHGLPSFGKYLLPPDACAETLQMRDCPDSISNPRPRSAGHCQEEAIVRVRSLEAFGCRPQWQLPYCEGPASETQDWNQTDEGSPDAS
jgi:hypothetical protein